MKTGVKGLGKPNDVGIPINRRWQTNTQMLLKQQTKVESFGTERSSRTIDMKDEK